MRRSPNLRPRLPAQAGQPVASLRGTPAQQWKRRQIRTSAISKAAVTPSVVPLGPKPRQGRAATGGRAAGWRRRAKTEARVPTLACTLPQGLRAGEEDRKEQSGHTLRGPQATGSCVSSAPVRIFQHSQPPLLPAQGHLHVPLQRGSRSPAQPAGELPGAMPGSTHSSQRPSRHFRKRSLAPPTPDSDPHGTSGNGGWQSRAGQG